MRATLSVTTANFGKCKGAVQVTIATCTSNISIGQEIASFERAIRLLPNREVCGNQPMILARHTVESPLPSRTRTGPDQPDPRHHAKSLFPYQRYNALRFDQELDSSPTTPPGHISKRRCRVVLPDSPDSAPPGRPTKSMRCHMSKYPEIP